MLGRSFSKADDTPGGAETVILTAGYWRTAFGGDRSTVGRTITLDGKPRQIIGVMPDGFRFLDRDVSLIVPRRLDRSKVFLGQGSYQALGRLKPELGEPMKSITQSPNMRFSSPVATRYCPIG